MKLYEARAGLQRILAEVDQAIDLDEDLETRLDEKLGDFENKVRATGAALLHAQRELENEIQWKALCDQRHKRAKARVDRLSVYIGREIHASTLSSVESEANGIPFSWGVKTTKRVELSSSCDPRKLPASVLRVIPSVVEVDKVAARKLIEEKKVELPGVSIVEHFKAKVS